jgi:hypothetical protein
MSFEAQVKLQGGRLIVKVAAPSVKELFAAIGEVQEVFDADSECGACSAPGPKFRVRERDKFKFYEMHCDACGADLAYGQHRDGGGIWPKRLDDAGRPMPFRGWFKFDPNSGDKHGR